MKNFKRLIVVFAFLLTFGMLSINADAATRTENMTLIKGEKVTYQIIGGTLRKVTTSKKKVVGAKKKKGNKVQFTAKKKGKSKIVCKTNRGSINYNIKVVNPEFDVKYSPLDDNYCLITFTNNTPVYFENVKINSTYRDSNGNVLSTYTSTIYEVGSKKKAYIDGFYDTNYDQKGKVDLSKTTYTLEWFRTSYNNSKIKDYTNKVQYNLVDKGSSVDVVTKVSCKKNDNIYAGFSVAFYDASGKIISVKDFYNYLYVNRKTTSYSIRKPENAIRWSIINKRAYLKTY